MHNPRVRFMMSVAVAAMFFAAVPSEAGKRRAVRHPAPAREISAELSGTVVDNVTGQPVIGAHVKVGRYSATTDTTGKYELRNITGADKLVVEVSRTGYHTKSVDVTTSGKQTLNFRLDPGPVARVTKSDGTTVDLDFDSIEFGYPVPFSGYYSDTSDQFCRADGTQVTIDRTQMAKITGPGTSLNGSACCPNVQTLKINLTLKSGETGDYVFVDACNGYPNIDLIGRNHVTGELLYIAFTQLREVTFP